MSPFKTFQSSGSSSNEVDLRKKPKRNNRWASDNKEPSTQALVMARNFTKQKAFHANQGTFAGKKLACLSSLLPKWLKLKVMAMTLEAPKRLQKNQKGVCSFYTYQLNRYV
jgi:hypothetical protein